MAELSSWADHVLRFCDQAVSGGYLVAMVLICALQYLYQLIRSYRAAEVKDQLCRQIDNAKNDLRSVSRDRTLTSLENQILREFAGELDLERTLDQLIRRLVEETKDGFAAYVPAGALQGDVTLARGLSEQSRELLLVDAPLLERVRKEGVTVISKVELYGTRLYENLSAADRGRFERLFLAGIGNADDLAGVIVTTSLIPVGIPLDEQIELAKRLMRSLSGIVEANRRAGIARPAAAVDAGNHGIADGHRPEAPLASRHDRGLRRSAPRDGPGRSGRPVPGQRRRQSLVQTALPLRRRPVDDERQETRGTGSNARRNGRRPQRARVPQQRTARADRHRFTDRRGDRRPRRQSQWNCRRFVPHPQREKAVCRSAAGTRQLGRPVPFRYGPAGAASGRGRMARPPGCAHRPLQSPHV